MGNQFLARAAEEAQRRARGTACDEALHTRYGATKGVNNSYIQKACRKIIDQFITTTFYRSTVYPPWCGDPSVGIHLKQPAAQFEAMDDEWDILEPPQPRAPS